MHLPLTQEDIGDATGLTGVHVNRVLRDLRRDRIVEFHYRRLRILNPDKLIDVAGIDPHVALSWIDDYTCDRERSQKLPGVTSIPAIVPVDERLQGTIQLASRTPRRRKLIPEHIHAT
jgi:hypothetical protein